jgi:probable selenium-dependent hydroxylase accessory protein YqeC
VSLADLLEAREGIVCAVGAGGKKSALYALASEHRGRVAFTTTVHTLPPPEGLFPVRRLARSGELARVLAEFRDERRLAYASPGDKPGRWAAVPGPEVAVLHAELERDLTLVKADGARMRWVKAPGPGEPVLATGTATVIVVLSARALGEPLGERVAHRPGQVGEACGLAPGEPIGPQHLARLFAVYEAACRNAGARRVVPLINMVDDEERGRLAQATAEATLAAVPAFARVVLACLRRADSPVAAVVAR